MERKSAAMNVWMPAAPHRDLVSKVIETVRGLIRDARMGPGDPLPSEAEIGRLTGVSRVVVREAFRALAALGIVDVGNGRRARIAAINPGVLGLVIDHSLQTEQVSVQQILDVRRTIELRTVALAALLRSDKQAEGIFALAGGMRRDFNDAALVMEHDIGFHRAIAIASHNPMFALVVDSLQVVTRRTWQIGWAARPSDEDRMASVACHETIAVAILAGDRAGAERAMATHFDTTTRMLLDSGIS
jgi:GntR family transcriptional repressor for pyruvate dehydrogenase complex